MMPGMDGFEVCRTIKGNVRLQHVPVIMVTALDQASDRIQGLEAGADDFLTKPVDDVALVTRVKNVARLKMLNDEMLSRAATTQQMGMDAAGIANWAEAGNNGRILLVEDHPRYAQRMVETLGAIHRIDVEADPQAALLRTADHNYDLIIVSLSLQESDGLRLCSQFARWIAPATLPLIILVNMGEEARLLARPRHGRQRLPQSPHRLDGAIGARSHPDHAQAPYRRPAQSHRRKCRACHHRRAHRPEQSPLYGNTSEIVDGPRPRKRTSALDPDHRHRLFKLVNDSFGHDGGDAVLREFANRLRRNTRGIDFACRLGGEEFVIIMPDTDLMRA